MNKIFLVCLMLFSTGVFLNMNINADSVLEKTCEVKNIRKKLNLILEDLEYEDIHMAEDKVFSILNGLPKFCK